MKKQIAFPIILVVVCISIVVTAFAVTSKNGLEMRRPNSNVVTETPALAPPQSKKIRLALLLDTSNSMDGLIDQAKSQLWNIVDEMTEAEYDGIPAELHLALYEYGNDGLSVRSGYVRQVNDFTQDLDEVSTQLFALKTNGGSEYCGTVIDKSLDSLEWGSADEDLNFIFIAGNEDFNQGGIDFEEACAKSNAQNVIVNTIYCGDYRQGINELWKKGAEIGGGSYMNIDMDQKTVYVSSPYDTKIDSLNSSLNKTYIGYGSLGSSRKAKQLTEDNNAQSLSQENKVKRTIAKSKKHAYKNAQWDLVDAVDDQKVDVSELTAAELPEEMKTMNLEEKKAYIKQQKETRDAVQKQIGELAKKRKAYVKQVQDSSKGKNELESAIMKSVKAKAKEKSFKFKEE